jgi:hypothetical protein
LLTTAQLKGELLIGGQRSVLRSRDHGEWLSN